MMNLTVLSLTFLLPIALFLIANLPIGALKTTRNTFRTIQTAIFLSLVGAGVAITWLLTQQDTEITLFSVQDLGLAIRIDALSTIMYTMISIIAFVVVRFSKNYLEGEERIRTFFGRLALTLAFVQLLVVSGNLATLFVAWVGTSIGLHQLLLFYPERKKAILAARKKFIVARLADFTLLSAFVLIYLEFGNANLSYLFEQFQALSGDTLSANLQIAALLLVISAALKSVQLPFHGWLLDVMETPTPVSALLHAGLLNAGPFLIIRFAYLIDLSTVAWITLISIGALSALFGAIASTTQPSIKTALAYSSIGHMGFTLMLSGFGVYAASLLHLVAHSFYKAHAFLSSGSIIEKVQTKNASNVVRSGRSSRILLGILIATVLFTATSYFWGITFQTEIQLLAIAAIILLGIVTVQVNAFDSNINTRSLLLLLLGSALVINLFFLLERLTFATLSDQIPEIRAASTALLVVISIVLLLFTIVVGIQFYTVKHPVTPLARTIRVHIKNGLYLHILLDRIASALVINSEQKTH